jgi:N-methylhydantoinase A
MRIEVLNWGLTVTSPSAPVDLVPKTAERNLRPPTERRDVWCVVAQDWASAGVFERAELAVGDWIPGPALIVEPQTTTLVTADFGAEVDAAGNLWLIKTEAAT